MNLDDLHLTRFGIQASVLPPIPGQANAGPGGLAPLALSAKGAGAIYGEISRYGYNNFQTVPGGAQIASGDGVSVVTLTGAAWAFQEDLTRSSFHPALEKMAVTIGLFREHLPEGTRFFGQVVDIQGLWENLGSPADDFISKRFLKDHVSQVAVGLNGLAFSGAGVRLSFTSALDVPMPQEFSVAPGSPAPLNAVDVKLEPFFADKSKLFVQVTGQFPMPTSDTVVLTRRAQLLHDLLMGDLASQLTFEA